MTKSILIPFKTIFFCFIFVLVSSIFSNHSLAQCAGLDNTTPLEICNIPNASSQTINLFALLGGTPTAGGTWSDDLLSGGLNPATGILNAQQINQSGIYTYTYTVTGVAGCTDNSSTVSVLIGGYAGVTGPNASICSDSGNFNLFQVFNGSAISPQINGTWFNNTTSTAVPGYSINVTSLGIGTFQFTYTIPAIGSCPVRTSTAFVTIYRAPKSGTAANLVLCDSDNLAALNNLDLNSLLIGEDAGGKWTESGGTNEITSPFDHNVNVQNIYNTLGPGTYTFSYRVLPPNPTCSPSTTTVTITIEKRLDFTGATIVVNSDICENLIPTATYAATITQGTQAIANGQYNVTYQISGANTFSSNLTANFVGGVMNFPLSPTLFQQVGNYVITITNITKIGDSGVCVNIVNNLFDDVTISPIPRINNATLTIDPICQNSDALVQMSVLSNLTNGNYQLTYNLSGSNTVASQSATINVVGGLANFTIPASLIPNTGNTTISITNIVNTLTTCANTATLVKEFVIKPLPVVPNLVATATNVCKGGAVTVSITGLGTLTSVNISYNITGANTTPTTQSAILVVTNGNTSFTIPNTLLPNSGLNSITITNLSNTGNSCGVIVSNVFSSFRIFDLPVAPIAVNKSFCKTDNATVGNLSPNGVQYQWFDSATSTTPLLNTASLISANYYVQEVNATTTCKSARTMITVVINELQTPILNPNGQKFCGLDKPTLQQLSNNTAANTSLVWFNAAANGNQLPNTTLLQDGVTYYGFDFSNVTNCYSTNGLAVTVTLTNCDTTTIDPIVKYDFFIPDGFSPNGDGVNDSFSIPKIQFLFPNYTLDIYNRYGNIMFKGDINKPNWDGRNNESGLTDGIAPNGVYFYVINFNKENASPKQGRLYLNR
jgi:gliding motility-associated-like protein